VEAWEKSGQIEENHYMYLKHGREDLGGKRERK
jgi:hypothetical protein